MMQFLANALMAFASVCLQISKMSFFQNLFVGFLCTIGGGIFLYMMYSDMDKSRYHRNQNWSELPGDIWHTHFTAEYPIQHSKMSFGEKLSPEDEQILRTLPDKLYMYVDYPISMVPMHIAAYKHMVKLGSETVPNLLPRGDGQKWQVRRNETQKAPTGYIRERVEFIRIP